jgi:uncharacterized protein (TIGR03067 family)
MDVCCLVLLAATHCISGNVPAPVLFQITVDREPSLEGEWSSVSAEVNGKDFGKVRIRFGQGTMDLRVGKESVGLNYRSRRGALDCMVLGRRVPGIYRIEGNRLLICFGKEGGERPRTFASPPGSDHLLLVLVRQRR